MKQKRKVKNLLHKKTQGSSKLSTALLFTVSGVLCMFAMILFSAGKVSFAAPLQYTGVNDNNQVVYEVNLIDPIDYATDVHSMYVTGGSVYVTPKPLIVNRTIGNTDTQNPNNWDSASNQVLGSVYGNILGGELNKISSDNVTIIAGASNEVNAGNENATILGGEGNTLATNGGEEGVMVGGKGNEINSNGLVVGGEGNTVNTSSSRILGGEGNTVNANNAIVGGKNVEGNAENAFVYSSDGSYYEANAGGTFYLGVENGLGINTDGNTKGLSVEGSLGEGEINVNDPAQKCNTNNIGMQGMYQGCLVGCTSKSAAVGKWEMMDQGEECRKKEEGREQSNENIMQSPKLQEEKLLEDLPAGKCSEGTVNTWQSTICGTPASYKGMIFETTLVDQGKCPVSTDKLKNNQCVYACNAGSRLTGDVTNHTSLKLNPNPLAANRNGIIGCFKDCSLDGKIVKHNETVIGYNVSSVSCSNDSYTFPTEGNGIGYETCGNDNGYIHKKTLICIDGTLYLNEGSKAQKATLKGYNYNSCNLGGYDCKTDASNYFIPESTVTSTSWEGRTLNGATAWGDDRNEVKGTKGTYELCISYNAPTAVNGETCTKKSFHYKLKSCNAKYYWKSDSEGCQLCEPGYYCPGGKGPNGEAKSPRKEVDNGYYAIAGQDHQTQCPDGYRDGTAHENKVSEASCLRNMPAGYYMASGKSTSNTECANGYYKTAHTVTYGATTSCTICPAGYRNGTSVDNKKAENVCLKNVAAGYYVPSAHAAETVCANGYYRTAHTVTYGATTSCTICPAGYRDGTVLANKTAENVCLKNVSCGKYVPTAKGAETNCPAGYYRTDAHTVTYGATSSCTKASAGSYVGSAGQCAQTACGGGKWSNAGASACSNINAGCYGTSATSACPAACGAGKWSAAGSASCSNISCGCYGTSGGNSCPAKCAAATSSAAGSYSSAGVSSCTTESRNGYYVASAGACGPSACPAGYYCPAGKIIQCPAGSYCPAGSSTYTACGGGKWSAAGASACSNINAGCYGTSATNACPAACGGGKWSAAGSASCSNISAGCYGTSAGSACPAACGGGKWSAAGSASCSNINAGCYGTSAGNACPAKCAVATASAVGTYSKAGASSCTSETRNGYYVASAGASGPSVCPAGYYCPAGKIIACPAGSYCPAGSSAGSTCPAGSYCPAGSSAGSTCPAGYYCPVGANTYTKCPAGYYCPAGSSTYTKCPAGYYCPAGSSTYTACLGRTKYSAAGASACSTVSAGYYTTGCDGSGNKCTGQAQCGCGSYCSNGVSYACGAGKYSGAGATSCSTASVGYYANSSCSQTACTNKPANSSYTSNSSSNSCSWSCNTYYHQEGSSCVYNWRDVACNRAGAPSNASYNSYNVTVAWNGSSWNGAANCSWYCNTNYHQEGSSCVYNWRDVACNRAGAPSNASYNSYNVTVAWNGSSWNGAANCSWYCNGGYHQEGSSCVLNCTTTAKSANGSAIAYSSRGNCAYGYSDPDTCGYDNSCDCYGNRTWDGVICNSCSDYCPSGYSKSVPSGCYDTATTQCGSTCYLSKTCPCTTTAKSAIGSAVAYSNKSSCSYGYEDPDICGYDNSCDCNGNRTWDGVICSSYTPPTPTSCCDTNPTQYRRCHLYGYQSNGVWPGERYYMCENSPTSYERCNSAGGSCSCSSNSSCSW